MPRTRKMLTDWNAPYLMPLVKEIETQSKATLAGWAIGYSEQVMLPIWVKHDPSDTRPEDALHAAREWLSGTLKLPEVKPLILACHAAARDATDNPAAQAAARAIGQSASTIHSARHCVGLPLYGALAAAYDALGTNAPPDKLERYVSEECGRMLAALTSVGIKNEPNPAKINWYC
jgi:hypothetical protein